MLEQIIHFIRTTVDKLNHIVGCACLYKKLNQSDGCQRHLLRWLKDKCITRGNREGKHPKWNHGWKIKRGDTQADTQRLVVAHGIDAISNIFGRLTHHITCDISRLLYHLDAAPDIAFGILKYLARIHRQELAELIVMLLEKGLVTEHQASTLGGGDIAPCLEGIRRSRNRGIDLRPRCER